MPRFYFNVFDDRLALDQEGLELADVEAARFEALRGARSLIAEQALKGRICLHCRIEVEWEDGDGERRPAFTLPFRSAVEVES